MSVYFGMNYYVYNRIVNGLMLFGKVRQYLKIFFLIAGLSFILGQLLSQKLPVYPLLYLGAFWLGIISISFTIFILKDILGLFLPNQTKFLTLFALFAIFLISVFSVSNAAQEAKIKEIEIKIRKLPLKLSGFSVVQLSDLHLGRLTAKTWLESIVNKTNKLKPDLIAITGDLADEDIRKFDGFCEILQQLKAKYGIFAVTGNHEFYLEIDKFLEIAQELNITVLRNEKITLANTIELVGIDDNTGRRFSKVGSDLQLATRNCDFQKPVILLSHQSDIFDEAVKFGIDLQLSGHNHAGQIPPLDLLRNIFFKYPYGLYQKNSSYLYTTAGTGTWGPPMRFLSRSEIIKITLKS